MPLSASEECNYIRCSSEFKMELVSLAFCSPWFSLERQSTVFKTEASPVKGGVGSILEAGNNRHQETIFNSIVTL